MTKKLSRMPYAQAHVDINGNTIVLVSYTTPVIIVDENGILVCTGLYSMTTRKHISAFLKEYFPFIDFHTVKMLVNDQMAFNTITGELISMN